MERSTWLSVTGANDAPPLVERHTPPLDEPARIRLGSAGEIASALMRPLAQRHGNAVSTGVGPRERQRSVAASTASLCTVDRCRAALSAVRRAFAGIEPNGYARSS